MSNDDIALGMFIFAVCLVIFWMFYTPKKENQSACDPAGHNYGAIVTCSWETQGDNGIKCEFSVDVVVCTNCGNYIEPWDEISLVQNQKD